MNIMPVNFDAKISKQEIHPIRVYGFVQIRIVWKAIYNKETVKEILGSPKMKTQTEEFIAKDTASQRQPAELYHIWRDSVHYRYTRRGCCCIL